jgi:hypothetical protein
MNINISTTHPTLRSLWNIPMIIRIPEPMPPAPEVLKLIHQRIAECRIQIFTLDPHLRDYDDRIAHCKHCIFILEHKITELRAAFPDLPEIDLTPLATDAPTNTSTENCGQAQQPSVDQPTPEWPNNGQEWPDTGQQWPDPCQLRPDVGQGSPHIDQLHSETVESNETTANPPAPNPSAGRRADSERSDSESKSADTQKEDESLNALHGDEGDESEEAEEPEDREEADLEAEMAGFINDAERMAEAAADLQAHLKKRNRFDDLTSDAQAAIIAMLDHHDLRTVARTLAKPPPDGMSFKISKSGLNYFRNRYTKQESERRKNQNAQATADLLDKSEDPDKAFHDALQCLLRMRVLTTASEPDAPIDVIDNLITTLTKLRKQSLAERKQAHAERTKS